MSQESSSSIFDPLVEFSRLEGESEASAHYLRFSEDDSVLQQTFEREYATSLAVFDELMTHVYRIISILMKNISIWEEDEQRRFVHASLFHAFNNLMLARQIFSRGYFFEGQLILRSSQEWLSRSMLFHEDNDSLEEFVEQGELKDRVVRNRLEAIFNQKDGLSGSATAQLLRRLYSRRSMLGHATFQSLVTRGFARAPLAKHSTDRSSLRQKVGRGFVFGGYLTHESAIAAVIDLISAAEALAQLATAQVPSKNSDLVESHARLRKQAEGRITFLQALFKSRDRGSLPR